VYGYANGTNTLAVAAQKISKKYADSDAFAHATVSDVHNALGSAQTQIPGATGSSQGDVGGDA
jgi:hypothetical protein